MNLNSGKNKYIENLNDKGVKLLGAGPDGQIFAPAKSRHDNNLNSSGQILLSLI